MHNQHQIWKNFNYVDYKSVDNEQNSGIYPYYQRKQVFRVLIYNNYFNHTNIYAKKITSWTIFFV